MKKIIKGNEPPLLNTYRTSTPSGTWERFTRNKTRKNQTQQQIKDDQSGICAYCEIDLKEKDSVKLADFRVEHFHPKSDKTTTYNWGLDWQNLFGCCHGGSQQNVVDAVDRFSTDHSCDVPKEHKILDTVILNPLQIPAFPAIYSCERFSGELNVHVTNCQSAAISEIKAQQTIDELQLNAPRLQRFRAAVLNQLYNQLIAKTNQGVTLEQACAHLAQAHLRKNANQHWPAFFTSIRSYLGSGAEHHLRSINYNG